MRFVVLLSFAVSLPAADLNGSAVALLSQKCQSCHGPQVQLSGLRLDTREAILRGGKQGAALTPGKPQDSLLFRVISGGDKVAMPPTGPLSPAEVSLLREWITAGAVWPTEAVAAKKWWSFEKVKPVKPPVLADAWVRTPVDAFILQQLRAKGLSAAPEADRRTLIRRAMLDLHGLPPTATEIEAFEKDSAPDAYEKLIDRLLASTRYGEKWGKNWLDLVRYGDTSGFEQDPYLLYAWRYRDYVIDSFNADKPYDRFVKEQLAGDEIYEEPIAQQGTGYYTVGPNRDMLFKVEDINRVETMTDFVDTTSSVFLGLTVGCARCHDHKYDPISQKDYFRLQAIFAPIVKSRVFLTYNLARQYDLQENTRQWKLYDLADEFQRMKAPYVKRLRAEKLAQLPQAVQIAFATEEDQRTPQQKADFEMFTKKVAPRDDEVFSLLTPDEKAKLDRLKTRLLSLYSNYAPGPFSPSVTDSGPLGPPVYIPGKESDEIPPGFLSALGHHAPPQGTCRMDRLAGTSANGARRREPCLAGSFRPRHRRNDIRLRSTQHACDSPGASRMARQRVRRQRLELQAAPSHDDAFECLSPADQTLPRRTDQRPREPMALALHAPPPGGRRGPRRRPARRRHAQPEDARQAGGARPCR